MGSKVVVSAVCLLLVAVAMAADGNVKTVLVSPAAQVGAVKVEPLSPEAVPQHMNLQGYLTDPSGVPVDGSKSMRFDIYRGGSSVWNETQTVNVVRGLFSVVMGSTTPIPYSVFSPGTTCELQLTVEGQALSPRVEITSVGHAYRSVKSDTANYAIAGGGGGDNDWVRSGSDSVLYTIHGLGIARGGLGNKLYGYNAFTCTNFGVNCTTGASGGDYAYITVGGGAHNIATRSEATVAGGAGNTAADHRTFIGGGRANYAYGIHSVVAGGYGDSTGAHGCGVLSGRHNFAGRHGGSDTFATVCGGDGNTADSGCAFVGGGHDNTARGLASTVGGGAWNTASARYATVGGGVDNTASGDYATVGGGFCDTARASYATVAGGFRNVATGSGATVSGGYQDTASGAYATVGGGIRNTASANCATVGGGYNHTVSGNYATVGGGQTNTASNSWATVGGGDTNFASGGYATVGGGEYNTASGLDATVPGGVGNAARGSRSFAAGSYAKANAAGAFVWNDSVVDPSDSTYTGEPNRWVARARGGVYFYTSLDRSTGSYLSSGGSSWQSVSDSMTKENFRPVDRKALLDDLARMRVRDYNLKTQDPSIRHIGPVAQDFHNAFGFGESNTAINMEDADGVLLAAVQALYDEVKTDKARIAQFEAELAQIKK
jgi:hypothetical protein